MVGPLDEEINTLPPGWSICRPGGFFLEVLHHGEGDMFAALLQLGVETVHPIADGKGVGKIPLVRREESPQVSSAGAGRENRKRCRAVRAEEFYSFVGLQVNIPGDSGLLAEDGAQGYQTLGPVLLPCAQ